MNGNEKWPSYCETYETNFHRRWKGDDGIYFGYRFWFIAYMSKMAFFWKLFFTPMAFLEYDTIFKRIDKIYVEQAWHAKSVLKQLSPQFSSLWTIRHQLLHAAVLWHGPQKKRRYTSKMPFISIFISCMPPNKHVINKRTNKQFKGRG